MWKARDGIPIHEEKKTNQSLCCLKFIKFTNKTKQVNMEIHIIKYRNVDRHDGRMVCIQVVANIERKNWM